MKDKKDNEIAKLKAQMKAIYKQIEEKDNIIASLESQLDSIRYAVGNDRYDYLTSL